jgi:hypothetical protein
VTQPIDDPGGQLPADRLVAGDARIDVKKFHGLVSSRSLLALPELIRQVLLRHPVSCIIRLSGGIVNRQNVESVAYPTRLEN